jgi:hypothetical protein
MKSTLTNKKLLILCIGIGVLAIAISAVIVSLVFSSVILNETIVTANIRETPYEERTFTVEESGTHSVSIALQAKGFLTAVRIVDETGELAYQDIVEAYTTEFTMEFQKGAHTLSLTYLPDYAAVEQFYKSTGQSDRFPESRDYYSDYYKEAPAQDVSHTAVFAIKIR